MATRSGVSDAFVSDVDQHFEGRCLRPGDAGFEAAIGLWNGATQRTPAVVLRCRDTADVVTAIDAVTTHDAPFSVKAGGHMTTGHAVVEDGVVVDLAGLDDVAVDAEAGTVRVGGGAVWEDVNEEALEAGLIPPGIPEAVGVAGFTLGGGMGVTCRLAGLACDNLREAEVVTADGEVVTASAEDHPDLFWALRGGAGNVGIVTELELDCVEGGRECLVANVLYPIDEAASYLRYLDEALPALPEATFPAGALMAIPELPDLPAELHGEPAVAGYVMGVGTDDALEEALEAFADFGNPHMAAVYPADYTDLYEPFAAPDGQRHRWESCYLDGLSDAFIERLLEEALPLPTPLSSVSLYGLGGAIDRVPVDATAYPHRGAPFAAHVQAHWLEEADDERCIEWTRELHESLRDVGTGGEYVNNQTDTDQARVKAAYGEHYDRLAAVKATWDPEDRFRSTQHVEPDDADG